MRAQGVLPIINIWLIFRFWRESLEGKVIFRLACYFVFIQGHSDKAKLVAKDFKRLPTFKFPIFHDAKDFVGITYPYSGKLK